MRKAINYHATVARLLTEIVRKGGTVVSDAGGLRVCGLPAESGAYETIYTVSVHLFREERDEYGRVLKREMMNALGEWIDATEG